MGVREQRARRREQQSQFAAVQASGACLESALDCGPEHLERESRVARHQLEHLERQPESGDIFGGGVAGKRIVGVHGQRARSFLLQEGK